MTKHSEFVDWVVEQLVPLGRVRARRMFGGFGLYLDDLFFAIVQDDVLYLKADALTKQQFIDAGSEPFRYANKNGKTVELGYFQAPDQAMDDGHELMDWVRLAVSAALRAPKK